MSTNTSAVPPTGAATPLPRATVPAMYRSDDEVNLLLQEISAEGPSDTARRRQVTDILDDLAEELIGRGHEGDRALKIRIRQMRVDLDRAAPIDDRPDRR